MNEALIKSAIRGDLEAVRAALDDGADVESAGRYTSTLLVEAARYDREEVALLLVERGANISVTDSSWGARNGRSAIHFAAAHGRVALLRALADRGADIDAPTKLGFTPLIEAASNGRAAMVRGLVERGAEVDKGDRHGTTPLMRAAGAGHQESVLLLTELGADVSAANKFGNTALGRVVRGTPGSTSIARILMSHGAVDHRSDKWQRLLGDVPLVRDCRDAVEEAAGAAGDRDVARICGDYVSMVDRWRAPRRVRAREEEDGSSGSPEAKRAQHD